jgi:hypothetical protein
MYDMTYTNQARAEVGGTVQQSSNINLILADVELGKVVLLSSVDGGLIHTLNNGRSGTKYSEKVELKWLSPSMRDFLS